MTPLTKFYSFESADTPNAEIIIDVFKICVIKDLGDHRIKLYMDNGHSFIIVWDNFDIFKDWFYEEISEVQ